MGFRPYISPAGCPILAVPLFLRQGWETTKAGCPILAVPLFLRQGWDTTKASPVLVFAFAGCPILAVPLFLRQGWDTTKASPVLSFGSSAALCPLAKTSRKVSQKRAKHTRVPPRNANLINNIEGIFRKKHPTPPFLTKTGLEAHPNRPPARLARAGGQRKSQPDERRFSAVCRQPATAQAACRGRAKSRPGLACLRSREGCVPSRSRSRSALRQQRG